MAERARPELARAVHPADDAAGGELRGDTIEQRRSRRALDGMAVFASARASSSASTGGPQNG